MWSCLTCSGGGSSSSNADLIFETVYDVNQINGWGAANYSWEYPKAGDFGDFIGIQIWNT